VKRRADESKVTTVVAGQISTYMECRTGSKVKTKRVSGDLKISSQNSEGEQASASQPTSDKGEQQERRGRGGGECSVAMEDVPTGDYRDFSCCSWTKANPLRLERQVEQCPSLLKWTLIL
jgi:hypothetical protein